MILKIDSERDSIREQVALLLSTRVGEQALDRDYGIDTSFLDMPTETAKAMFTAEVIEKLRKYVAGATVENVTFEITDGKMNPTVVISVE